VAQPGTGQALVKVQVCGSCHSDALAKRLWPRLCRAVLKWMVCLLGENMMETCALGRQALEVSALGLGQRLGVEHIDLCYQHRVDLSRRWTSPGQLAGARRS
jgi:threonine dehydrogenase-like Zn-dependent dehydrogenase